MKRLLSFLICVAVVFALMGASADQYSKDDILQEFPGYVYNSDSNTLMLKGGDLHEAPELQEGNCFLYTMVSDSNNISMLYVVIGGSLERGMPHRMLIRTIKFNGESKEYDIDFLADKVGNSTIALLDCSYLSALEELPKDMLDADMVSIVLRNSRISEDEEFTLNPSQKRLLEMSYSYHCSLLNDARKKGMAMLSGMLKGNAQYTVEVNPYEPPAGSVSNGVGGLYPWLTKYMKDRYPDYNTEGKTVEDYLTYLIGTYGLGLKYKQLYNMLSVLDSEELVTTTLDALLGQ